MNGLFSSDQDKLKVLEQTQEYQELITDPRLQFLRDDPVIKEKIDKKDFLALLRDERFQKIMQDPELVQKLLKLNQKLILPSNSLSPQGGDADADDIH